MQEIADLQPGMMLEGVVTNVTNFGAFVDVGVHQDGLVHVSELSNRFVKDPNEVVKVGQIVQGAGALRRPQGQAHRAFDQGAAGARRAAAAAPPEKKAPEKKPSLDDQISRLADRFRTLVGRTPISVYLKHCIPEMFPLC